MKCLHMLQERVIYIVIENNFIESYVLKRVLFRFEILYSTIDTLSELFK